MPFAAGRLDRMIEKASFTVRLTRDPLETAMEMVTVQKGWHRFGHEHRFRLVLCGHQAVEAGAACIMLMVQGHLTAVTLAHLLIASKTGFLAVSPALAITFTQYARHFLNKWAASGFLGICAFLADAVVHQSHYHGEYTEALLTGLGAFLFSVILSLTPLGKRIDRLAHVFLGSR